MLHRCLSSASPLLLPAAVYSVAAVAISLRGTLTVAGVSATAATAAAQSLHPFLPPSLSRGCGAGAGRLPLSSPFSSPFSAMLSDSHAHLEGRPLGPSSPSCCGEAGRASSPTAAGGEGSAFSLSRVVVCGTHPSLDWAAVEALALSAQTAADASSSRVVVGFGVHPWYVPELPETPPKECGTTGTGNPTGIVFNAFTPEALLTELEERLKKYPNAIVAEIGLDKLRGPSPAAQEGLFLAQMRLAAQYQRPVSIHCVRHHGRLLELLDKGLPYKEDVPPAVILHGFSGSSSVAQSLLKLKPKKASRRDAAEGCPHKGPRGSKADAVRIAERIYFGIGRATSLTLKDCLSATLPLLWKSRRVLVETDRFYRAGDAPPAGTGDPHRGLHLLALSSPLPSEVSEREWTVAEKELREARELLCPVLEAVVETHGRVLSLKDGADRWEDEAGPVVPFVVGALERTFDEAFASVQPNL